LDSSPYYDHDGIPLSEFWIAYALGVLVREPPYDGMIDDLVALGTIISGFESEPIDRTKVQIFHKYVALLQTSILLLAYYGT
jgi:hypothetical protein